MTTFVGREQERRTIKAIFDAPSVVGDVVLVTGEPGIGKSSLVQHAIDLAASAGWRVNHATADELDSGRVHALLGKLFPELRGSLAQGRTATLPRSLDFAISPRLDTADALAAHVERLRTSGSVLLAVDDLQWADAESLHALGALVRRARSLGVVIVAAHRPDPTSDELALLLEVARDIGATEIVLGPLGATEVEHLAGLLLEGPLTPDLRAHLPSAGGNPWLIGELVQHAPTGALADPLAQPDAPGAVPPAVHDAVRRRLRSVDDEVATLLRVAAVLGKTFTIDEVARVASEPAGRVAIALARGADAGFLADDGETMTFRHDLFRQALEAELPRSVARALHREAASVLHGLGATKARIAPHLVLGARGGDAEAFGWLVDAAEEASLLAPASAADLLASAARLCSADDPRRARTEGLRARLLIWGGRPQAAEALAAELLVDERDPTRTSDLQGIQARALFLLGRPGEAAAFIDRMAAAGQGEPTSIDSVALAEYSLARLFASDLTGAAEFAELALVREPDGLAVSLAHSVLGWTHSLSGRSSEAKVHADAAIETANTPEAHRYVPHLFAAVVLNAIGDVPGARLAVRTGRSISARLEIGWDRAMFDWAEATMAFLSGEWSDALALGEAGDVAALESGLQLGALWHMAIGALIATRRGEPESAQTFLDRADALVQGGGIQLGFDWWAWAHAVAACEAGAPANACALLSGALRVANQAGARSVVNLIGVDLVKAALSCEDREAAARASAALADLATASGLELHRGLADHVAGLIAGDVALIERAIEELTDRFRPYDRGRAMADASLARAANGESDLARVHGRGALAVFDELGATVDSGRLREALRALGVVVRGESSTMRASTGWDSLTRSERTVVDLVARGLSNAEVADRLFVSRRTVESHLLHVYAKVGSRSRVELARQAAARS